MLLFPSLCHLIRFEWQWRNPKRSCRIIRVSSAERIRTACLLALSVFSSFSSQNFSSCISVRVVSYCWSSTSLGKIWEDERGSPYILRFLYPPLHCFPREARWVACSVHSVSIRIQHHTSLSAAQLYHTLHHDMHNGVLCLLSYPPL